ncbi:sensor histidine kinase [Leptodesmis sp.]|uniref:sensor histidine kinase n=1 Tax=Leptodesmis sp. TaxID=3100501 RepID=UPI00405359C1
MNVGFLLGLGVGLALFGWYWLRLNLKLRRIVQQLRPDLLSLPFSSTSRLTQAIAAYQQAHRHLEQDLQDLQYLIQVAPIGFLQVDEDNQLLSCNPKACELLSLQNYQATTPRLLLELVRSYELDALVEETRQAQKPCQSEWLFHPVNANFTKLSQQQSRPLRGYGFPLAEGCIAIFLESREETVKLAQQRDRWISDVAHELKTPLTSIRLVAETLQSQVDSSGREWIGRLLQETIRLSNLVQDLLDLNQLQSHSTARLTCKLIDLVPLIHSAWLSLEPLARVKQVQLDYIGPDQLVTQGDEAWLYRAFINLFDNSIKYSPPHQKIQVRLQLQSAVESAPIPEIQLDFIDAGPGFPDSALPFVFERFYRADPSRTRHGIAGFDPKSREPSSFNDFATATSSRQSGNSTGLGLAIVKHIVEAHRGQVSASNHPETGGAWLQIRLPQSQIDQES